MIKMEMKYQKKMKTTKSWSKLETQGSSININKISSGYSAKGTSWYSKPQEETGLSKLNE